MKSQIIDLASVDFGDILSKNVVSGDQICIKIGGKSIYGYVYVHARSKTNYSAIWIETHGQASKPKVQAW